MVNRWNVARPGELQQDARTAAKILSFKYLTSRWHFHRRNDHNWWSFNPPISESRLPAAEVHDYYLTTSIRLTGCWQRHSPSLILALLELCLYGFVVIALVVVVVVLLLSPRSKEHKRSPFTILPYHHSYCRHDFYSVNRKDERSKKRMKDENTKGAIVAHSTTGWSRRIINRWYVENCCSLTIRITI